MLIEIHDLSYWLVPKRPWTTLLLYSVRKKILCTITSLFVLIYLKSVFLTEHTLPCFILFSWNTVFLFITNTSGLRRKSCDVLYLYWYTSKEPTKWLPTDPCRQQQFSHGYRRLPVLGSKCVFVTQLHFKPIRFILSPICCLASCVCRGSRSVSLWQFSNTCSVLFSRWSCKCQKFY